MCWSPCSSTLASDSTLGLYGGLRCPAVESVLSAVLKSAVYGASKITEVRIVLPRGKKRLPKSPDIPGFLLNKWIDEIWHDHQHILCVYIYIHIHIIIYYTYLIISVYRPCTITNTICSIVILE